jgi:triosephosphate isomerase
MMTLTPCCVLLCTACTVRTAVNESNCGTLANLEDVDGFLVGGASLKGSSFINICNAENKHS